MEECLYSFVLKTTLSLKLCEMILNWGKKMWLWLTLCVSFNGRKMSRYMFKHHSGCLWVLLGEVSICINTKLSHVHCPPQCESGLIHSVKDLNRTKRLSKRQFPPAWWSWAGTLVFASPWPYTETSPLPGSQDWLSDWSSTISSGSLTSDLGTCQPPESQWVKFFKTSPVSSSHPD